MQSEFEIHNQEGLKKNPPGLRFNLQTQGGRNTCHLYETIPFEMVFTSSRSMAYSIELLEGTNPAGQSDRFEIEPANSIVLVKPDLGGMSIVCCISNRPYLSAKPVVLRKELTDILRFEKPGVYEMFVTTHRVFEGNGTPKPPHTSDLYYKQSQLALTSNLLTLTILPDDPEWDTQRLADVLRQLHDPQVIDNYNKTVAAATRDNRWYMYPGNAIHFVEQTAWLKALKGLNALDTQDAIHQRVANAPITMDEHELRSSLLPWQFALASTSRPNLMVAALLDRAKDPAQAVDDGFASICIRYMNQRDHPEMYRPSRGDVDRRIRSDRWGPLEIEAKQQLVPFLRSTLPTKTGAAKKTTSRTLEGLELDIARASQNPQPGRD